MLVPSCAEILLLPLDSTTTPEGEHTKMVFCQVLQKKIMLQMVQIAQQMMKPALA
jgi:hypothetical protein